jgi:hypothetical protein
MSPKLSEQRRIEIMKAEGSLREIARQYRVSPSTIRRIQTGDYKPRKPKPHEILTTPFGTLVQDSLVKRKDNRYWIELRLSASEAAPIIKQVEDAISDKLATIRKEEAAWTDSLERVVEEKIDAVPDAEETEDTEPDAGLEDGDLAHHEGDRADKTRGPEPGRKWSLLDSLKADRDGFERAYQKHYDAWKRESRGKQTSSKTQEGSAWLEKMSAIRDVEEEVAALGKAHEKEEKLMALFEAGASNRRPYIKQEDGSYVFMFESTPLLWRKKHSYKNHYGKRETRLLSGKRWGEQPKFSVVDGSRVSKLRKPKLVTSGRKVSVVFSVVPRFKQTEGIGAVLSFSEAKVRRQHPLRAKRKT